MPFSEPAAHAHCCRRGSFLVVAESWWPLLSRRCTTQCKHGCLGRATACCCSHCTALTIAAFTISFLAATVHFLAKQALVLDSQPDCWEAYISGIFGE